MISSFRLGIRRLTRPNFGCRADRIYPCISAAILSSGKLYTDFFTRRVRDAITLFGLCIGPDGLGDVVYSHMMGYAYTQRRRHVHLSANFDLVCSAYVHTPLTALSFGTRRLVRWCTLFLSLLSTSSPTRLTHLRSALTTRAPCLPCLVHTRPRVPRIKIKALIGYQSLAIIILLHPILRRFSSFQIF
jgi:hypothetical protein